MSEYEFMTPEEAGNIRNWKKDCDTLKRRVEELEFRIFERTGACPRCGEDWVGDRGDCWECHWEAGE